MNPQTQNKLTEAMFKVFRYVKESMQHNTKRSDMSMLQLYALMCINKKPHIQMREIASWFRIELPSATSLVNKLHELDLVKRTTDAKDRRITRIDLTEKGQHLCKTAILESNQRLEKLFTYLSENDKKELLRILTKLTQNIEENNEK